MQQSAIPSPVTSIAPRLVLPFAIMLLCLILFSLTQSRETARVLYLPLCDLAAVGPPNEHPFLDANDAAMNTMMRNMTIEPSGDVDRDFVALMVPHHEAAIAMAQALLRDGRNEKLRRMAQEIIVTQQQEIAVMRLAIGEPSAAPDQSEGFSR